jgi:uncharacterized membrane protein YhaH (DUF805 family)
MYCSNCGKEVNTDANFCRFCGHNLQESIDLDQIESLIVPDINNELELDDQNEAKSSKEPKKKTKKKSGKMVSEDLNVNNPYQQENLISSDNNELDTDHTQSVSQSQNADSQNMNENFLSFGGRLRRFDYSLRFLVLLIIFGFVFAILADERGGEVWTLILLLIIQCIILIESSKRFHDFGRSGYNTFLLLIPIVSIYFYGLLFFKDGNVGSNEYGPDPKNRIV